MKTVSLPVMLAAELVVVAPLVAGAQSPTLQQRGFRPGDRVVASPLHLKDQKYWRPGTVAEVHNFTPKRAYSITFDPDAPGASSSTMLVTEEWVKTGAPAPPEAHDVKEKPQAHGGTSKSMSQPQATKTAPDETAAPADLKKPGEGACPRDSAPRTDMEKTFRPVIKKIFEKKAEPGADGSVSVSIQKMDIGESHSYREYEDPNESRGKAIYPVRAKFTTCTDYKTRTVLVDRERAFACYQNTTGEWVCDIVAAADTNVKDVSRNIEK